MATEPESAINREDINCSFDFQHVMKMIQSFNLVSDFNVVLPQEQNHSEKLMLEHKRNEDFLCEWAKNRFTISMLQKFEEFQQKTVICQLCDKPGHTAKNCLKKTWFKDQKLMHSLVIFLRAATIHQIKSNQMYQNYLKEGENVESRCRLIQTMGEEAEHLEINALLSFLDLGCKMYQLDNTNTGESIQTYTLPEENSIPKVYLLYRPGHYDLLYKQQN